MDIASTPQPPAASSLRALAELDERIQALEKELASAAGAELAGLASASAETLPGQYQDWRILQRRRERLWGDLSASLQDAYQRAAVRHSARRVVEVYRHRACGGCNISLTQSELLRLQSQGLLLCRNCSRVILAADRPAPRPAKPAARRKKAAGRA